MGRKERREREQKRENYATKRSSEKRKNTIITIGVLAVIAVIVGYSVWVFMNMTENAHGAPEGAGPLNNAHTHSAILVKIFGDTFDFSSLAYQAKTPWIHFEGGDGTTVHKHATGVTLEYLFNSMKLQVDDKCFIFQDGRQYCTNEDNSLRFFINDKEVNNITEYEPMDQDRILIVYGSETPEEIQELLKQVDTQLIIEK